MPGPFLSVSGPTVIENGTDAIFAISVFGTANALVAPVAITGAMRNPVSARTTPAPTLVSTGQYTLTISPTLNGRHSLTIATTTPNLDWSGNFMVIQTAAV